MRQFSKKVILLCLANACIIILLTVYLQRHAKGALARQSSAREELRRFVGVFGELFKTANFCVIEPRILWNLLNDHQRKYLKEKNFQIENFGSKRNVLSVAVSYENVGKLRNEIVPSQTWNPYWEVKSTREPWMNSTHTEKSTFTSHFLLQRKKLFLHIVVLYERGNYFWAKELQNTYRDLPVAIVDKLPFGHYDSAYGRFRLHPYSVDEKMPLLYVPRTAGRFLFQIPTSRFISCLGIGTSTEDESRNDTNSDRPPLWLFKKTALAMLKKMEYFTVDSLMQFWLASGTLLGWYRDCGLIPYTSDVDFCAWGEDLTFELVALIQVDEFVHLLNMLGKPSEDFELWLMYKWLRVDIFFAYEDKRHGYYYIGGHRPEETYSFRYRFPKFTLCTGDFLGYRVLVPCDPEAIIEAEYGKEWRNPVKEWNYELSARNVIGRRYWNDEEIYRFVNFGNPKHKRKKL